ncbi:MAG: Unsaturated glucuronyl hydrolase [Verrucomicrobia subdivision 3 bacterium]|nr:Unsaturated glucuronyl hydrolase [Limisphaerales bacterium]MCS1413104.1 Unsaturated glucuronyl hydrolase [Limisphaerales bacterium]
MAIRIDQRVTARKLLPRVERLFEFSAKKIRSIQRAWNPSKGTPVFTVKGHYTSRGWTEWTQGFQFGSAVLQFDVTGEAGFLEIGREASVRHMASHVSHIGVHDHGFNNVSTYGNLLRLMREGRIPENEFERAFYELALKVSGATQAARWTTIANGEGYIYSFNGPHSLFIDTIRSLRVLALAHRLGHVLMGEMDRPISLLRCMVEHARSTATYGVYYGTGRDAYDVKGRTAHESVFNLNDGSYRCPNSQQGYSPFSTWTRGLAWAVCGYAEQLEFLTVLKDDELKPLGGRSAIVKMMHKAALATSDFYIDKSCCDGIPLWDTGAPGVAHMGDYLSRASDPCNLWEPMDSSAAAIAAQGLIRLGNYLKRSGGKQAKAGKRYKQAGLTVAGTLFDEPYLSTNEKHQGLILHSVYHRPNAWDYVPPGHKVPCGESSMWGDYHARELALMIWREGTRQTPYHFYDCVG